MCFRQAQCTPSSELRNVIANYVNSTIKLYCMRVMHISKCFLLLRRADSTAKGSPYTSYRAIYTYMYMYVYLYHANLQIKGTASNVYPGRLQAHLVLEGFLTTVVRVSFRGWRGTAPAIPWSSFAIPIW